MWIICGFGGDDFFEIFCRYAREDTHHLPVSIGEYFFSLK
jgi:hypothetical protein